MQLKLRRYPERGGYQKGQGGDKHPQGVTPGIQLHHRADQKSNIPGYGQNQVQVMIYDPWLSSNSNTR